jgi:hypothetical protein
LIKKQILQKVPNSFIWLSLLFLAVNLLQSSFTELANDEAYYWRYAQELDWGYFDHPPFIALMTGAFSWFIEGELGVRLVSVLFGFISLYMLWFLLDESIRKHKNAVPLFFLLWFSFPVFNVYTFITVPDSPLLFFSFLYLLVYKKFRTKSTIISALLLGLVAALLLYSKYHGVLLIVFVILADIKVLKNKYLYLAGLFALILLIPHIIWQYEQEFATLKYHFFERNSEFKIKFLRDYPLNVFIILNPLLFGLFIYKEIRNKTKDKSEKIYRIILWGFIVFFLFSAFKNHVEPHWIAISTIPLFILLLKYALENEKTKQYVKAFSIIGIFILLFGRIILIFEIAPIKNEFHGYDIYFKQIQKEAGNRPVLFRNSFSAASKYEFYTSKPAFSFNTIHHRKNQYDIWDYEDTLFNKAVCYVLRENEAQKFEKNKHSFSLTAYEHYQPVKKVLIKTEDNLTELRTNTNKDLRLILINPYKFKLIRDHSELPLQITYSFRKGKRVVSEGSIDCELPEFIPPQDSVLLRASLRVPNIKADTYQLRFSLTAGELPPGFNGKSYQTEIKK